LSQKKRAANRCHSAERLKEMKDHPERLKAQGIEAID